MHPLYIPFMLFVITVYMAVLTLADVCCSTADNSDVYYGGDKLSGLFNN